MVVSAAVASVAAHCRPGDAGHCHVAAVVGRTVAPGVCHRAAAAPLLLLDHHPADWDGGLPPTDPGVALAPADAERLVGAARCAARCAAGSWRSHLGNHPQWTVVACAAVAVDRPAPAAERSSRRQNFADLAASPHPVEASVPGVAGRADPGTTAGQAAVRHPDARRAVAPWFRCAARMPVVFAGGVGGCWMIAARCCYRPVPEPGRIGLCPCRPKKFSSCQSRAPSRRRARLSWIPLGAMSIAPRLRRSDCSIPMH